MGVVVGVVIFCMIVVYWSCCMLIQVERSMDCSVCFASCFNCMFYARAITVEHVNGLSNCGRGCRCGYFMSTVADGDRVLCLREDNFDSGERKIVVDDQYRLLLQQILCEYRSF